MIDYAGQFEPAHPSSSRGGISDLFQKHQGISPEEAGKEDARAAMATAREILKQAAVRLKETFGA